MQHDPAAHAGTDQYQRPIDSGLNHCQGILSPCTDAAVFKLTTGGPVSGIIQSQHRLPLRPAKIGQILCFGARHIRAVTAQKYNAGGPPGFKHISEFLFDRVQYKFGFSHRNWSRHRSVTYRCAVGVVIQAGRFTPSLTT